MPLTSAYDFDLFISYASKDDLEFQVNGERVPVVKELKRALERHSVLKDGR
jgi:hypothetical protein